MDSQIPKRHIPAILVSVSAALAFAVGNAHAAPVYGTSADFVGSRSTTDGGGLTFDTTEGLSNDPGGDLSLSWDIVDNSDGTFDYNYTLDPTELDSNQSISHFTIDLSDDCDGSKGCATDISVNDDSASGEFGDLDGIEGAVKIDEGGENIVTYSLTSTRLPVWGDVFIKEGQWDAENTGFQDRASDDSGLYVARPNGEPVDIPLPGTLALLAFGAATLGFGFRRRK